MSERVGRVGDVEVFTFCGPAVPAGKDRRMVQLNLRESSGSLTMQQVAELTRMLLGVMEKRL